MLQRLAQIREIEPAGTVDRELAHLPAAAPQPPVRRLRDARIARSPKPRPASDAACPGAFQQRGKLVDRIVVEVAQQPPSFFRVLHVNLLHLHPRSVARPAQPGDLIDRYMRICRSAISSAPVAVAGSFSANKSSASSSRPGRSAESCSASLHAQAAGATWHSAASAAMMRRCWNFTATFSRAHRSERLDVRFVTVAVAGIVLSSAGCFR